METVEQFLARGGKVTKVRAGARAVKVDSGAKFGVYCDETQSWEEETFSSREEAMVLAKKLGGAKDGYYVQKVKA